MKNIHGFILAPLLFGQLMSYSPTLSQAVSPHSSASQEASKPQGEDKKSEEKGEVDRMIDDLKSRNELVLGACLEGAQCEPIKVNGQAVHEPVKLMAINIPHPAYPPVAKAARALGDVNVQVLISEEGRVVAAQVLDGHPLLRAASIKAAREATFTPPMLGKTPVKITGVLAYRFHL
jgi:TonB family protein